MIFSSPLIAELQLALRGDPHPLYVRLTSYRIPAPRLQVFVCYCERRIQRPTGTTTWCPCGREISAEDGPARQILYLLGAAVLAPNPIFDDLIWKEKP